LGSSLFPILSRLSGTQGAGGGGGTAAFVEYQHKGPSANFLLFSTLPRARKGARDADADADAGLSSTARGEANKATRAVVTFQPRNHEAITLVFSNSGGNLNSCAELDL
jgi:hypothetical protein